MLVFRAMKRFIIAAVVKLSFRAWAVAPECQYFSVYHQISKKVSCGKLTTSETAARPRAASKGRGKLTAWPRPFVHSFAALPPQPAPLNGRKGLNEQASLLSNAN